MHYVNGLPPKSTDVSRLTYALLCAIWGASGFSNTIWDKPGQLTAAEFERVRLPARPDGNALTVASRILAWPTPTEPVWSRDHTGPHAPPKTPLSSFEMRPGRAEFDGGAVDAVLRAAG